MKLLQGTTVMGSRGQIVIPHTMRKKLKIRAGDEMVVFEKEGKIIVMPAKSLEKMYNHILGNLQMLRKHKKA